MPSDAASAVTAAKHLRCARRKDVGTTALFCDEPDAVTDDATDLFQRSKGYRFWLPCAAVK